ncbi:FHA domain-containing protein [Microbacterium sp. NPDC097977]|uniref:FHA domain-containing protein n=1 Tax=Microbacterium sp. NPDC097977 TaxID=3155686 RepID=UPI00332D3DBB
MTIAPPAARLRPPASPVRTAAPGVRATAGQRAGAYLIDIGIIAVIATLVWVLTGSLVLVAVTVIELWAIGWVWEGHTGATPGNLICRLRTVQRDKDASVGARGLFLRNLVMGLAHVIPVLLPVGLAAAGVLDGLGRARVIDVRKTRSAATDGMFLAPDLEARVTGPDAAAGVIAAAPGVISQTPLSPSQPVVAAPVSDPVDAGSVAVFELSDGTVIEATGLGYIGRAPRAPETIPDAILVRVPDGTRSLSRTHAAFGVEDGKLWVQDLGSANGAAVRHLGGSETELSAHNPYFLVPGDVLVLGGDAELAYRRVAGRGARPSALPSTPATPVTEGPATPSEPAVPTPAVVAPAVVTPAVVTPAVESTPLGSPSPAVVDAVPAAESAPPATQAPAERPTTRSAARLTQAGAPASQAPATPAAAAAVPPAPTDAQPTASPVPSEAPQAVVALQFTDGTTVPITGLGYIGRAPRVPEGEHAEAVLVAVPDGDRSVSRTHGRFGVVDGQPWFEDLGSGNGSSLRTADGRSGPMTPHQRFGLTSGMTLQVGDCLIQIVAV